MGINRALSILFMLLLLAGNAYSSANKLDEGSQRMIALMHFAPITGDMAANTKSVLAAMKVAKDNGATWFVTPELSLTGYYFDEVIGTDWLVGKSDPYRIAIQEQAQALKLVTFLSHIEHADDKFYNSVFVVNQQGNVVAKHRKINTIPGSEAWSTPGEEPIIAHVDSLRVGLLICADAWPAKHAAKLKDSGVDIVISPANWGPGKYGPGATWANRSKELGVPLVVNNRTGIDKTLDLREALSIVAQEGKHSYEFSSEGASVILLEIDEQNGRLKFLGGSRVIDLSD